MASDAEPSVTYILGIPRWIWGIILNIVGQVLINFGTNVMKYGHGLSPPEPPKDSRLPGSPVPHRLSMDDYDFTETDFSDSEVDDDKKARSKGKWMKRIGSLLFITGGVLNFVSMGFAAQSLLASLGSVQFVTNVVFGKFVLGELVTARTWLATVVIMSGNLMIVFNSNRASVEFTANQLFWAYTKDYKYYMAAAAASLIVIQFGYIRFTAQIRRCELKSAVVPKWLTTGQGMCYALFSAILGTQSMLQAKCMSELLRLTTTGTNQMTNPFTYGVIFIYIVSTVFWLSRMNYALQHYDGLFIIPVLQVFWLVLTIVSGGIYFQEFKTFGTRQMTGFSCGVLVLFVGVYMLMPRDDGEDFSRMDDDDDDLHIDINVEVNEDFAGKSRRHSSDPALPEGLPPLGEGIGGGDDGSPKRERVSSGGERQSHSRVGKKKVAAFGHYDENRKDRARLMSFGFMPVVSYDRRLVKMTDWTIERKKYLKPLTKAGGRMVGWVPVNLGRKRDKDKGEGGVEMGEELRRRTLTQDGVVDIRSGKLVAGKDVDVRKIGAEWERERQRRESEEEKREARRSVDHRRSFSQPAETVHKMMAGGEVVNDFGSGMSTGMQPMGVGGRARKRSEDYATDEEVGGLVEKNSKRDSADGGELDEIEEGRESIVTIGSDSDDVDVVGDVEGIN